MKAQASSIKTETMAAKVRVVVLLSLCSALAKVRAAATPHRETAPALTKRENGDYLDEDSCGR